MNEKHDVYLNIAKEISRFSKCTYFKVGAIVVKDGRIMSTGYNGTPSGFPIECHDIFSGHLQERSAHHNFTTDNVIHAEENSILFSARKGVCIEGSTLYCTHQPCHNCTKTAVGAGIKEIYYREQYDKANPYSKEFCAKNGVIYKQIT